MTPAERARALREKFDKGRISGQRYAKELDAEAAKNPDSPFSAYLRDRAHYVRGQVAFKKRRRRRF